MKYSRHETVADRLVTTSLAARREARKPASIEQQDEQGTSKNNSGGRLRRAFTAALCALALFGNAARRRRRSRISLRRSRKKWTAPFEPVPAHRPTIHYVGTDGIAVYVIKTSQGLILMDTALPESTGMIKDNIANSASGRRHQVHSQHARAFSTTPGWLRRRSRRIPARAVAGERDKPLLECGYYPERREERGPHLAVRKARSPAYC